MAVLTYSSSDVVMAFGGITVENWDSITVTRTNPSFRPVQGIRGKNTRVKLSDTSATIEVTVPVTSDLNYIFTEILRQDELTGNARISLTVKDSTGVEVFSTYDAYIQGMPAREYTREIPARVWVLCCMTSEMSPSTSGWGIDSVLNSVSSAISGLF